MKFLLLSLLISSSTAVASSDYTCSAKANPNRGFESDFKILISPAKVGGDLTFITGENENILGKISDVAVLHRDVPSEKDAFRMTIQFIGEADVSGVSQEQISKATAIEAFRAEMLDGDEAVVYRLLEKDQQVGGSFMVSGMGTACLNLK